MGGDEGEVPPVFAVFQRWLKSAGLSDAAPAKPWVLELRIHGVHNTPPQSMLGVRADDVRQVAGDGITGVYRTKDGKVPPRKLPEGTAVEAYSWGNLTSGVQGFLGWARRIGWLALLPFALVNLSYWARPELAMANADQRRAARFGARVIRVSGLLMTALFVLTPLTFGVDLVGWQCYRDGAAGCSVLPDAADFMARSPFDTPERRIAVGSLLAVAAICLVWFLSHKSISRYEAVRPPDSAAGLGVLRHSMMWDGSRRTRRLQGQHLVVAFCTVILYTGIPLIAGEWGAGGDAIWSTVAPLKGSLLAVDGLAALLALAALVGVTVLHDDDVDAPARRRLPRTMNRTARVGSRAGLAVILLLLHLVVLVWPRDKPLNDDVHFPGENTWFVAVFLLITALHVCIFVTGQAPGWKTATSAVASVGALIVLLYTSTYLADDDRQFHLWGKAIPDVWPSWAPVPAMIAVLVLLVLAIGWNWRRSSGGQSAWGGAGASVLMATAIWLALLFTTSVLAGAASWLNGEQSVADLGSQYTTPDVSDDYVAAGDVSIEDANIVVVDRAVNVVSGTVVVDTLRRTSGASDDSAISVAAGSLEGQTLLLPDDAHGVVAFEDSCVFSSASAPDDRCTAHAADHPLDGALHVDTLTVGAAGHPVAVRAATPPQAFLTLPQILLWIPMGQLALALIAGAIAGVCWFVWKRRRDDMQAQVAGEVAEEDRAAALGGRMRAGYLHRAEFLVQMVGLPTSLISVGVLMGGLTGRAPWEFEATQNGLFDRLATFALSVSVVSSLGLIWLASKMRKSTATRRAVGILWDLTTFWPRAASPFAPPCYAERVVPELMTRVNWALHPPQPRAGDTAAADGSEPGDWGAADKVIVSAHSQGSVIAVAALSRLSDTDLERVRLITYGSQIRAWYGRIFPAVFSPEAVGYDATSGRPVFSRADPDVPGEPAVPPAAPPDGSLRGRLNAGANDEDLEPRWINLFRRTDPIGFRVFSDYDEEPDRRAREVPSQSKGDPGPQVKGHSGYQHSPEYRLAVAAWTGEDPPEPSEPAMLKPPFIPEP